MVNSYDRGSNQVLRAGIVLFFDGQWNCALGLHKFTNTDMPYSQRKENMLDIL